MSGRIENIFVCFNHFFYFNTCADGSKSTPIMSTNVIAFLLLYKFRDGCTLDDLVNAVDSMRQELEFAKRDAAFSGESIDVVNHAVSSFILFMK